jgi:hypothetical protein
MSARRAFLFVALAFSAMQLSACVSDGRLQFYGWFEQPTGDFKVLGPALAVAEVEAKHGRESEWQKLKSKMKPGDELYRFYAEEMHDEFGYSWSGYALVRRGRVIATFTTSSISFG